MKLTLSFGCLLLIAGVARGGTIISTYGPGGTFLPGIGWGVFTPAELAYPFRVPAGSNYLFMSASLALEQGPGNDPSVTIRLASDAGSVPGAVLETFNLSGVLASYPNPVPVTATSALHPLLTSGSIYWLIVSHPTAGNGVNWLTANVLTDPDLQATRLSPSSWFVTPLLRGYNFPGAFSVDATAANALPESSTWSLCLLGIVFFGAKRFAFRQSR